MLDRLSFRRFLGLSLEDPVPDANTVWKYEELLVQKNLTDELFYSLLSQIEAHGYRPQGGQIVDATLVEAPKRKTEEQQQEKARKAQEKSDGDDDDPTPPASSERTPAQQRQARPVVMRPGRRSMARATSAIKITPASINSTNSFAATKRLRPINTMGTSSKP